MDLRAIAIEALVGCFLAGWITPEVLRRRRENVLAEPISSDLTGPHHLMTVAGFCALAAAFACVTAGAVLVAMISDTWERLTGRWHRRVHLTAAGVAFVAAFVLEAWVSGTRHDVALLALTAAYPATVGFVRWCWPRATAWQEKAGAVLICIWMAAAVAGA